MWSLQITVTLTEGAVSLIFCNQGMKNGWEGLEIEPTTLDLSSQSDAYDLSAGN